MSESAVDENPKENAPGIFGKMPAIGDFFSRRLSGAVIEKWDSWLQELVASSKDQLGPNWLDFYLTAPIWRCGISAGLIGERPFAGVMMPSVDRVGRYFPLTILSPLAEASIPAALPLEAESWFNGAEEILLSSLEDEAQLDDFDIAVAKLGGPAHDLTSPGDMLREYYASAVDYSLRSQSKTYSIWWTKGSQQIEPCIFSTPGLPKAAYLVAFLDGDVKRWCQGVA